MDTQNILFSRVNEILIKYAIFEKVKTIHVPDIKDAGSSVCL